jgi:sugar-specific transcriptional regulator TrmB
MDIKLTERLQSIGLTTAEAAIYAVLVERGGAFPSAVAEATRINRTTVYRLLDQLAIKGLVNSVVREKKQFYQAEGSDAVERYAKSRVTIAQRAEKSASQLGPLVDSLLRMASHKPVVEFYEGADGVRQVYRDHVNQKERYEMLGIANASNIDQFFGAKFLREYIQKKIDIGIATRGILPDTTGDVEYLKKYYSRVPKKIQPVIRYIPADDFPYHSEITIYGKNKISIVNTHGSQIIGVIIEDETTHGMMRMIFELAWNGADRRQ